MGAMKRVLDAGCDLQVYANADVLQRPRHRMGMAAGGRWPLEPSACQWHDDRLRRRIAGQNVLHPSGHDSSDSNFRLLGVVGLQDGHDSRILSRA